MRVSLILASVFGWLLSQDAFAATEQNTTSPLIITVIPEHPIIGQEAAIKVTSPQSKPLVGAVAVISVTYRPNSEVSINETLPKKVGEEGTVKWTPTAEGTVTIKVRLPEKHVDAEGVKDCSVRFDGMPLMGVIIFTIAFVVLFGGLAFALIRGA